MNLWRFAGYSQTPFLLDAEKRRSVWTYLHTVDQKTRRPWLLDEVRRQMILLPLLTLLCVVQLGALLWLAIEVDALHNSVRFSPAEIRMVDSVCSDQEIQAERSSISPSLSEESALDASVNWVVPEK